MMPAIEFLGLKFAAWSRSDVERWIVGRDEDSPCGYIVTPNVDHVVRLAGQSDAVRNAYTNADVCVCDSRVLKRLAQTCGINLELVTGSDLVEKVLQDLLQPDDRICLIGSSAQNAFKLQMLYPALHIVHHEAPMGLLENAVARAAAIEFAGEAGARLTLLGVGSPQQELLASEMASSGKVKGTVLCIGASVDFLVGEQSRAPRVVQMVSLEWCWRLVHSPRRLARRYLVEGPSIFPMVLKWRLTHSRPRQ
jgi:N-acetylglucosaminyldiphosphoundecaprenol N-acetyl-beta-D-mannosaminyltransferase